MNHIARNLQQIKSNIEAAAASSGRSANNITLLAVSKQQNTDTLRAAAKLGLTHFGENYTQEALQKMTSLHDLKLTWHFIGRVQRNKTQVIAQHFSWVHSIDRLLVAERLSAARPPHLPPLQVCIELNVDHESTKAGVAENDVTTLADQILSLPQLQLRGLMILPALHNGDQMRHDESLLRAHAIFLALQRQGYPLDTLSMGSSHDYVAAIRCGSTLVRLGSALLGARDNL